MKFVPGAAEAWEKRDSEMSVLIAGPRECFLRLTNSERAHGSLPFSAPLLILHTNDVMLNHWLLAALHGVLRGCAVLHGHWIYLEVKVIENLLQVVCWDGLDHQSRHMIWRFAEKARQILVVRTLSVSFNAEYSQQSSHTCGTVALMHLGHAIGDWRDRLIPGEEEWHAFLQINNEGSLYGGGRLQGDGQLIMELRDLLHHHGVPTEKTEERANLAIKKIGEGAIEKALHCRNP